jgi:hypothetical protein
MEAKDWQDGVQNRFSHGLAIPKLMVSKRWWVAHVLEVLVEVK